MCCHLNGKVNQGSASVSIRCQIIVKILGCVSCECSVIASRPFHYSKKGATQTIDANDWVWLYSKTLDFEEQVVRYCLLTPENDDS